MSMYYNTKLMKAHTAFIESPAIIISQERLLSFDLGAYFVILIRPVTINIKAIAYNTIKSILIGM